MWIFVIFFFCVWINFSFSHSESRAKGSPRVDGYVEVFVSEGFQLVFIHQQLQFLLTSEQTSCFFLLPNHSWSFHRRKEKKSENSFLQLSHAVKWKHTQILGVNCPSFALLSLFLSPSWQVFFCKYPMQLRCKQSKARACSVINNHLFRRQEGCWEGKAKTRWYFWCHYCIEKLTNVHYWKKYIMRGNM